MRRYGFRSGGAFLGVVRSDHDGAMVVRDTAPYSPPGPPYTERAHRGPPSNTWPRLARGLFRVHLDAGAVRRDSGVADANASTWQQVHQTIKHDPRWDGDLMIEISVDSDHNLVTFKNMGRGTKVASDAAFRTVKQQYDTHGPVKLLIDWTEYDGISDSEPHAAARVLEGAELVERVAFVIDPKWEAEANFLMRLFVFGNTPIKHFAAHETDAAVAWLISG